MKKAGSPSWFFAPHPPSCLNVYVPSAWTKESPIFFMQWQPVRCYQNFKWNRNGDWTLDHRFFNCASARTFQFQLNLFDVCQLNKFVIIRLQLTKKIKFRNLMPCYSDWRRILLWVGYDKYLSKRFQSFNFIVLSVARLSYYVKWVENVY